MKTIKINGEAVRVTVETYRRIARFARSKKVSIGKAVELCLQRVI